MAGRTDSHMQLGQAAKQPLLKNVSKAQIMAHETLRWRQCRRSYNTQKRVRRSYHCFGDRKNRALQRSQRFRMSASSSFGDAIPRASRRWRAGLKLRKKYSVGRCTPYALKQIRRDFRNCLVHACLLILSCLTGDKTARKARNHGCCERLKLPQCPADAPQDRCVCWGF